MSNIAISQINSSAQNIQAGDLLLVSKKNNDGSYTSAKIDATKLLASCRELDYSDERANISRASEIFKINGDSKYLKSNNNGTLDTAQLIADFGQDYSASSLIFDDWIAPYSGAFRCSFYISSIIPYNEPTSGGVWERTNCGIVVNNISWLHWHTQVAVGGPGVFPSYPDGIRDYSCMDCQLQWCYVNKGDRIGFRISVMTQSSGFAYLNTCVLIPFKYQ